MLSRGTLLLAIGAASLSACNRAQAPQLEAEVNTTGSLAAPLDDPAASAIELTKRKPELARQLVPHQGSERPGTIIVRTNERRLYYVMENGKAIRYPVGVGRAGKQWQGRAEHGEKKSAT